MGHRVRLADHAGRGFDREPTLKRLAVLAVVASLFGFGFTQCGTPKLRCSNPTTLTGPQGTLHYPPYVVQQDMWTGQGSQTMRVCGPDDWEAIANQTGPPESGVKTYPDSQKTWTDWSTCASQPTIGSFSSLMSTFAHDGPGTGSWDAAYDIFLNGSICSKPTIEVMIWTQWHAVSVPAAQLHPTIAGVPYDIYYSGNYYQVRQQTQSTSGTVNVRAVLNYLVGYGFFPSSTTMQFAAYGFEVLTTGGQDTPFWLTGFSVTDS